MDEEAPPENVDVVDSRPLEQKIGDKNWKARQSAYDELKALVSDPECDGSVYSEYVSWLPKMTADSNASALDAGLDAALAFVDSAASGLCSPYYDKLFANIVDKTFSGRASTLAKGKALMHKMIEVDDAASCTAFLLTKLADKKPKIPPTSLDILKEGIEMHGIKAFPVKEIIKALPAVFNGTNSAARDSAMALTVEIYRWIRLPPLQGMLDGLRTAQKSDFDKIIAEKTEEFTSTPAVPTLYLRKERPSASSLAAAAAAAAAAKETAASGASGTGIAAAAAGGDAREYVDEVDLMKKLRATDFAALVAEEKWSEQLKGLQIVIDAIGPVPKIKAGNDVHDVVAVIKGFLRAGHLQLQISSLKILCLLADGLRKEFGTTLRPIMQQIVGKCKEKRLVVEVQAVLQLAFTHCLSYDTVNDDVIEFVGSKKSPPHGKIGLMETITRTCATLPDKVGTDCLKPLATMLIGETEDSDPKVRESSIAALAAIAVLAKSRGRLAADAYKVVTAMENSAPKIFKRVQALMEGGGAPAAAELKPKASAEPTVPATAAIVKKAAAPAAASAASTSSFTKTTSALSTATLTKKVSGSALTATGTAPAGGSKKLSAAATAAEDDQAEDLTLSPEEAIAQLEAMEIPGWVTETGLPGMDSAKWQEKVDALGVIERRLSELEQSGGAAQFAPALVRYIAATSSGFKISNINILKATIQTAGALVKASGAASATKFSRAAGWELLKNLGDKLSDKKTKDAVQALMTGMAEATSVAFVVKRMKAVMDKTVSPLAHQYYLEWLKDAIAEFGCSAFPVPQIGAFCTAEMDNKNATVRTAAVEVMGALYHQVGPRLAAIAFADDMKPQLKALVEAEFTKVGHDPTAASRAPRAAAGSDTAAAGAGVAASSSALGGIPRQDLCSLIDKNIITELNFVDSKTSWQRRKVALESIIAACEKSAHYLEANKPTGEVVKALKPRMTDTQANLKPIAVSAIAHVVASLDQRSAGVKVLGSMASAMMLGLGDNKKPMRDSTIAALQLAVTGQVPDSDGNAPAGVTADTGMLMACIPAAAEALVNVVGRQELLSWLLLHTDSMKGDLSELVVPLILTLQDKNAGVRSTGEQFLTALLANNLTSRSALDKATRDLPPATKRAMQPNIDRMMAAHGTAPPKSATTAAAPVALAVESEAAAPAVNAPPTPPRKVANVAAHVAAAAVEAPVSPPKAHVEVAASHPTPARKPTAAVGHTPAHAATSHAAPTPSSVSSSAQWMLKRNAAGKLRRQEEAQRLNWPQPPDEPSEMEIAALKVVWRPIVTPDLAYLLFPIVRPGSPVNQDVYVPAMNELSSQLLCPFLSHHTEFLLRWICIVLCLKQESGPGLLRLLQLICDLMEALHLEAGTSALTDAEVSCILPHLVDRCGHRSEKHQALFRHAITLVGQIIAPGKLVAALTLGLRSHNKRSRVICLEELQRAVEETGSSALGPTTLRDVALCLDARDCDSLGRIACLDLITYAFNAIGKDIVKLKKSLGSDISDATLSLIEDRIDARSKTVAAPTPAKTAAPVAASQPTPAAAPALRVAATPVIQVGTKPATPAVPVVAAARIARTPVVPVVASPVVPTPVLDTQVAATPVSGEKLVIQAPGSENRDVWALSSEESAAGVLSPTARMMLEQIDRVMASTPLPSHRADRDTTGEASRLQTPPSASVPASAAASAVKDDVEEEFAQGTPLSERFSEEKQPAPVAPTPGDEEEQGDTISSLPSEFRSPAPALRALSSRMSVGRGDAAADEAMVQELNGLYQDILSKVDALLRTPYAVTSSDPLQEECKDYLKMLHSIVNGEWSQEKLPQDEIVLLAHSEALVRRLSGCIARSFDLPVKEAHGAAPVNAIAGVDVSLLAISLSVLFSLVKRPEVATALSEEALFEVFHECLHRICDVRITQMAAQQPEAEASESRETAQQVARALNNIVLKLGLGGRAGPVLLSMLRVMFCCIPAGELPTYADHRPLPTSSTKPASRLVIQILSEHGTAPTPYSEPAVQLRPVLEAIHHFFTRHPTSTSNDTPFRTVKTILNEIVLVKGGNYVLEVLRETAIPQSAFIYLLTCRLGNVQIQEPTGDLNAKIVAVIDDITSSRDKLAAIKELHRLKAANPQVDINLYLHKISAAFRRYVLNTLAKLDAADECTENTAVDTNAIRDGAAGATAEVGKTPNKPAVTTTRTPGTAGTAVSVVEGTPAASEYSSARSTPLTQHTAYSPATGYASQAHSAYKSQSQYTPSAYATHGADGSPLTDTASDASPSYAQEDPANEAMRILEGIKARPAQIATAEPIGGGAYRSYNLGVQTPGKDGSGVGVGTGGTGATPGTAGKQKRFAFNPETKRMEIVMVNTTEESPSNSPTGLSGDMSPFARRNDIIRNSLSSLTAALDLPRSTVAGAANANANL